MFKSLFSSVLVSLFALRVVDAANHDVNLSGLSFAPDHLADVAAGDTVTFHFVGGVHTATQSSLDAPCEHLAGGFDSETVSTGGTYQITVNDTNPIWVFCETAGHCRQGMVFAVNPGAQLANFQAAATGGVVTSSPPSTETGSAITSGAVPTGSSGSISVIAGSASTAPATTSRPSGALSSVGSVSAMGMLGTLVVLVGGLVASF
ncbi:hypothetical protein FRC17_009484 [Serendipita sp. 399]|nr:hypothetical protein FRC17_009484 [Serendipita sp. 399]